MSTEGDKSLLWSVTTHGLTWLLLDILRKNLFKVIKTIFYKITSVIYYEQAFKTI